MKVSLFGVLRWAARVLASGVLMGPLVFQTVLLSGFRPVRGDAETDKPGETVEIRDFRISVDGDRCGTSRMSIQRRPDGRHVVVGDSSLELKYFLYTFRFSSQDNEVWHDGRLEKLESAASYGGSQYKVSATGSTDSVVVKTDGKERKLPRHVWTTSYWHAPEDGLLGQTVPLLDPDKGRSLSAKLERVGEEPIAFGEKKDQPCVHYRLRGDVEVDLWYDAAGRLVRRDAVESGHKTRLELIAVK
jgi:Family of unknown function (DUF6134)